MHRSGCFPRKKSQIIIYERFDKRDTTEGEKRLTAKCIPTRTADQLELRIDLRPVQGSGSRASDSSGEIIEECLWDMEVINLEDSDTVTMSWIPGLINQDTMEIVAV